MFELENKIISDEDNGLADDDESSQVSRSQIGILTSVAVHLIMLMLVLLFFYLHKAVKPVTLSDPTPVEVQLVNQQQVTVAASRSRAVAPASATPDSQSSDIKEAEVNFKADSKNEVRHQLPKKIVADKPSNATQQKITPSTAAETSPTVDNTTTPPDTGSSDGATNATTDGVTGATGTQDNPAYDAWAKIVLSRLNAVDPSEVPLEYKSTFRAAVDLDDNMKVMSLRVAQSDGNYNYDQILLARYIKIVYPPMPDGGEYNLYHHLRFYYYQSSE